MPAQTFDDTSSVNGKVAGGGSGSYPQPSAAGGSNKIPSGVQQNDGTSPLGADPTTKRAEIVGPAKGSAAKAAGVQSFQDASV
jgi:hypothetical protein